MKWKKLGKIFDPTEHKLPNGCSEFAQSPQTLVFDDFVRIYFSTRAKDSTGKFLSHIAFVDFDKDLKNIQRISSDTVIKLGNLGCFDEHGIFPINPVMHEGRILAYTTGWSRRVSVSVETSIGLAYSEDNGLTFRKVGEGPVLTSSLHEPFLVGDAFVCVFAGVYYMWYIFGTKWAEYDKGSQPDRVYKIGYATSADGITWAKQNKRLIADKLNEDECQALPTVIKIKDTYHMFFCYREAVGFRKTKGRGYRIGYAYSSDLVNWTRDDDKGIDVSANSWDSDMMCYPHVFECNGKVYLLYNGNEFGKYGFGLAVLEE
jgi:hypothetical protein